MEGKMSFLQFSTIESKSGSKYHYIFECSSYRNKKQNSNKKKRVGKFDPVLGVAYFDFDYLQLVANGEASEIKLPSGMSLSKQPLNQCQETSNSGEIFSIEDIQNSVTKNYGLFYLLSTISKQIGLDSILSNSLTNKWHKIFMLVYYLLSCGDPYQDCEDWLEDTEGYNIGKMSSQEISRLLKMITDEERNSFYSSWCDYCIQEEYLALDITSTSSYSNLIDDVEWGYNRDKEKLAQINICMLVGEKSGLPIFYNNYSGSLKDVNTLPTTLKIFKELIENKKIYLVMDKGFYSKKNIDFLLKTELKPKFVIAMSFNSKTAKQILESSYSINSDINNAITINEGYLYSTSQNIIWNDDTTLTAHIFYNEAKYSKERKETISKILEYKNNAEENPVKYSKEKEYNKYLNFNINKSQKDQLIVSIKPNILEKSLKHSGWLIILTNDNRTNLETIKIYRDKDVVEKGFLNLKKRLDFYRTRVHSQTNLNNKLFIAFIALILLSKVHNVMSQNNLYKKMTMKKLFNQLFKWKKTVINDQIIYYPLTSIQKEIFSAFKIQPPEV
jgi:transposase